MINLIPIQQAYSNIFQRQKSVSSLKISEDGIRAYIGEKLSPSSEHYFINDNFIKHITLDSALGLPNGCPMSCDYCPGYRKHREFTVDKTIVGDFNDNIKEYLFNEAMVSVYGIEHPSILYGGDTDSLIYVDTICEIVKWYTDKVVPMIGKDIWHHCYTTGMFTTEEDLEKLAEAGVNELHFHLGASDFSETAYNTMRLARIYMESIIVETPSYPKHKDQLFKMLPIIEDIGVDQLNLSAIDIKNANRERLHGDAYKAFNMVLDDGGLVYDIMKEVIEKGYSYSVLDLNNFVVMHSQGEAKEVLLQDNCENCSV